MNKWKLRERHKALLEEIEVSEAPISEIDGRFADPTLYQEVAPEAIRSLEEDRIELQNRLKALMEEWEQVEEDLASLDLPTTPDR